MRQPVGIQQSRNGAGLDFALDDLCHNTAAADWGKLGVVMHLTIDCAGAAGCCSGCAG